MQNNVFQSKTRDEALRQFREGYESRDLKRVMLTLDRTPGFSELQITGISILCDMLDNGSCSLGAMLSANALTRVRRAADIHRENSKLQTWGLRLLLMLCLKSHTARALGGKMKFVELVSENRSNLIKDEEAADTACRALSSLTHKNASNLKRCVRADILQFTLSIRRLHHEDIRCQESTAGLLYDLFVASATVRASVRDRPQQMYQIAASAVEAMDRWPGKSKLVERNSRLLILLCRGHEATQRFVLEKTRCAPTVRKILSGSFESLNPETYATLLLLIHAVALKCEMNAKTLENFDFVLLALSLMREHQEREDVCTSVVLLLAILIRNESQMVDSTNLAVGAAPSEEAETGSNISSLFPSFGESMSLLLQTLRAYPNNVPIQKSICIIMTKLIVSGGDEMQSVIAAQGGSRIVIELMYRHLFAPPNTTKKNDGTSASSSSTGTPTKYGIADTKHDDDDKSEVALPPVPFPSRTQQVCHWYTAFLTSLVYRNEETKDLLMEEGLVEVAQAYLVAFADFQSASSIASFFHSFEASDGKNLNGSDENGNSSSVSGATTEEGKVDDVENDDGDEAAGGDDDEDEDEEDSTRRIVTQKCPVVADEKITLTHSVSIYIDICQLLYAVSFSTRRESTKRRIGEAGILDVVARSLRSMHRRLGARTSACRLLSALLNGCKWNQIRSSQLSRFFETVLDIFDDDTATNDALVGWACLVVANLSILVPNQIVLGRLGGIERVLKALKSDTSALTATRALDALWVLTTDHADHLERAKRSNGLALVLGVMSMHRANKRVQDVGQRIVLRIRKHAAP
eukprot:g2325.t1